MHLPQRELSYLSTVELLGEDCHSFVPTWLKTNYI